MQTDNPTFTPVRQYCFSIYEQPAMIPQSALRRSLISPIGRISPSVTHCFSTTAVPNERASAVVNNPPARPHGIDPRWLTTMKRRVGKCISFGLKPAQIKPAGDILQQLAHDWRELLAGSEGFLTDAKRRSLYKHNVVWGEMVRFQLPLDPTQTMRYSPLALLGCHGPCQ